MSGDDITEFDSNQNDNILPQCRSDVVTSLEYKMLTEIALFMKSDKYVYGEDYFKDESSSSSSTSCNIRHLSKTSYKQHSHTAESNKSESVVVSPRSLTSSQSLNNVRASTRVISLDTDLQLNKHLIDEVHASATVTDNQIPKKESGEAFEENLEDNYSRNHISNDNFIHKSKLFKKRKKDVKDDYLKNEKFLCNKEVFDEPKCEINTSNSGEFSEDNNSFKRKKKKKTFNKKSSSTVQRQLCGSVGEIDYEKKLELKLNSKLKSDCRKKNVKKTSLDLKFENLSEISENEFDLNKLNKSGREIPSKQCSNEHVSDLSKTWGRTFIPNSESNKEFELKIKQKLKSKREFICNKLNSAEENSLDSDDLSEILENNSFSNKLKITYGNISKQLNSCGSDYLSNISSNNLITMSESDNELEKTLKTILKTYYKNNCCKNAELNDSSFDFDDIKAINNALENSYAYDILRNNSSCNLIHTKDTDNELEKTLKMILRTYYKKICCKERNLSEADCSLNFNELNAIKKALFILKRIKDGHDEPSTSQAYKRISSNNSECTEILNELDCNTVETEQLPTTSEIEENYLEMPLFCGNTNFFFEHATKPINRDKYLDLHNFYMTFWSNSHKTMEELTSVEDKLVKQIFGELIDESEDIPLISSELYDNCTPFEKSFRSTLDQTTISESINSTSTRSKRKRYEGVSFDKMDYQPFNKNSGIVLKDACSKRKVLKAKRHQDKVYEALTLEDNQTDIKIEKSNEEQWAYNEATQLSICKQKPVRKKIKLSSEYDFPDANVREQPTSSGKRILKNVRSKDKLKRGRSTTPDKAKQQSRPKKEKCKRKQRLVAESEFCNCDQHVNKKSKLTDIELGPTRTTGKANNKRKRGKGNATNKVTLKKARRKNRLQKNPQVKKNKCTRHLIEESDSDITYYDTDLSKRSLKKNSKAATKLPKRCKHSEEDILNSELPLSYEFDFCDSDSDAEKVADLDPNGSKNVKPKNKKRQLSQRSQKPRQKKLQNKAAKKYKSPQPKKKQVAKNKQQKPKNKHPLDMKSLSSSSLDPFTVRSLRQRLLSILKKTLKQRGKVQKKSSLIPYAFNIKNTDPEILRQQYTEKNNSDSELRDFETMVDNMEIDDLRCILSSDSDESDFDDD